MNPSKEVNILNELLFGETVPVHIQVILETAKNHLQGVGNVGNGVDVVVEVLNGDVVVDGIQSFKQIYTLNSEEKRHTFRREGDTLEGGLKDGMNGGVRPLGWHRQGHGIVLFERIQFVRQRVSSFDVERSLTGAQEGVHFLSSLVESRGDLGGQGATAVGQGDAVSLGHPSTHDRGEEVHTVPSVGASLSSA